jgi:hypothetical protein
MGSLGDGEESAARRTLRHSFLKMGKARASRAREEQRWCSMHHHPQRCGLLASSLPYFLPSSCHPLHLHLDFVLTPSSRRTSPHPDPRTPFPAPHSARTRPVRASALDAPVAPFGVHRMALACKAAGKDVGTWFGLSAAAAALRWVFISRFFPVYLVCTYHPAHNHTLPPSHFHAFCIRCLYRLPSSLPTHRTFYTIFFTLSLSLLPIQY